MSDHFRTIYEHDAERYDLLVCREDHEHNILPALARIRPLAGCRVVELGAGTGRLTRMLAPHVDSIHAYDTSAHMLARARAALGASGASNWTLETAENHALPAPDGEADIAIAGWTLGHCCAWFPERWREEIAAALSEMIRVLRPGGTAIILETLGTGRETPQPPSDALAAYYDWLVRDNGFSAATIRTDYRFASAREAGELLWFFFGEDFADRVSGFPAVTLPECTGVWWKSVPRVAGRA